MNHGLGTLGHRQRRLGIDQAVLGAVADVPTISGKASVKIPPGTSSGVKLRLRGKGAHGPGGEVDRWPTERSERVVRILQVGESGSAWVGGDRAQCADETVEGPVHAPRSASPLAAGGHAPPGSQPRASRRPLCRPQ